MPFFTTAPLSIRITTLGGLYNNPAYPLLPDIESRRGDFDIATFPVEPDDVIVFHPSTLRGGSPARENETRCTLSLRFFW